jgi:hypothetical protein
MTNTFLTNFLTNGFSHSRRDRSRNRFSMRRLRLENIENRLYLSASPLTITVTSSADSGPGTLREAIASASPGDTIQFARSVHNITLTSGELLVSKNLTVQGPGTGALTISGNGASRVFDISGPANVNIADLTVSNGEVTTTAVSNIADWGGAGILNNGATLALVDVTFSNNTAVGVPGQDEFGGGLFNDGGTATVSLCAFTNNRVTGAGSLDNIGGSAGGAIDNLEGGTLTVVNSDFRNNSVVSADGLGYYALGGAIENDAWTGTTGDGTAPSIPSTVIVTHCTFQDNQAQAGTEGSTNGGAVENEGAGSRMTLNECQINGNSALGGANGVDNFGQGDGGGVMNTSIMVISSCTITNNRAVSGANPTPSANDSFAGAASGGGVLNGGNLIISNSTVSGNLAQGGASSSGPGGDAFGGGISSQYPGSTLSATDCQITDNRAVGGLGGTGEPLGLGGAAGVGAGGGIDVSGDDSATLVGCIIRGNLAQGGQGVSGNNGGAGVGGGLELGNQALFAQTSPSQATVIDCKIVDNLALGGQGAQGANGGDALGGGMANLGGCTATLTASTFDGNAAVGGTEGWGGASDGQGLGGGIYSDQANGATLNTNAIDYVMLNFASTGGNNIYST